MSNQNEMQHKEVQVDATKFFADAQRIQDFLQHVERHPIPYGLALLHHVLEANSKNFKINKVDLINEPQSPILGMRKN